MTCVLFLKMAPRVKDSVGEAAKRLSIVLRVKKTRPIKISKANGGKNLRGLRMQSESVREDFGKCAVSRSDPTRPV